MQYTKLLRCIEENPDDFAAAFQGLGVPPDVHKMARTHPECEHLLLSHLIFCGKDTCVSGTSGCSARL
jgi:hypothetical protein